MNCKYCGGILTKESEVCSFCGAQENPEVMENREPSTEFDLRIEEVFADNTCGGCKKMGETEDGKSKLTWWKEDDCGSCGGGLTGTDKDLNYALSIVGLLVGVIAFGLLLRFLSV